MKSSSALTLNLLVDRINERTGKEVLLRSKDQELLNFHHNYALLGQRDSHQNRPETGQFCQ